jgi:hypothetical protein
VLYHIVLFEPRPGSAPEAWDQVREAVLGLPTQIAGIRSVNWGTNESPEGLGQGYDHGFVMMFESEAARDAYLPHPAHMAIIPSIQTISA